MRIEARIEAGLLMLRAIDPLAALQLEADIFAAIAAERSRCASVAFEAMRRAYEASEKTKVVTIRNAYVERGQEAREILHAIRSSGKAAS